MARDYGMDVNVADEKTLVGGHPPIQMPVTLVSGASEVTLSRGTVLAMVTASGKYTGYDPDGADGSETAAAVLAEEVIVPDSGDARAIAIFHGDVVKSELVWTHDGITDAEKLTAYASLMGAGVYAK